MNNFDEYENNTNMDMGTTPKKPLEEELNVKTATVEPTSSEQMEVRQQHSLTQEQRNEESPSANEPVETGFTLVQDDHEVIAEEQMQSEQIQEPVEQMQSETMQESVDQATFTPISLDSEQENIDDDATEPTQDIPPKKAKSHKRKAFINQHKRGSIYAGCFLLALAGGFGGAYGAQLLSKANSPVLYQSVDNGKSEGSSDANASNMSVKDVANNVSDSVVEIKTESVATNSFFQQAVQSGAGSGVILSKDGYIVTNNHVIDGANKIQVTTKDGKTYEAKLVGTDPTSDLAVLKIEATDLTPAVLGTSGNLEVGDTAIAIGNPLGELGGTVTSGIISALDREITVDGQKMHLLQTSAAINPGNSGGGLFNDKGELIGVVNAKSSGDSIEGLGFAIPVDRAKAIIENLMENGYVKGRAALGVSLTESTSSDPFSSDKKSQVFIAKLEVGKAAEKAGLKVGDQILKVDDEEVASASDVKSAISTKSAGDKISLVILRDNETQTIEVTLGEASTSSNSNSDNNSNQNNQNDESQEDNEIRLPEGGLFR